MKLFIFKSHTSSELRAFAGDITGSKLPDRFKPWHVIGVVAAGRSPRNSLTKDQHSSPRIAA